MYPKALAAPHLLRTRTMAAHTNATNEHYNTTSAHAAATSPDQQRNKAIEVPQLLWHLHNLVVGQVQLVEINPLKSTPEKPLEAAEHAGTACHAVHTLVLHAMMAVVTCTCSWQDLLSHACCSCRGRTSHHLTLSSFSGRLNTSCGTCNVVSAVSLPDVQAAHMHALKQQVAVCWLAHLPQLPVAKVECPASL